jgi:hypothetical protein
MGAAASLHGNVPMSSARESVKAGLVLRKNEPSESARSKALGTSIDGESC